LDFFKEFFEGYRYFVYTALILMLTVILLIVWWERIKFWWMCTWFGFPMIGKIASLSKDMQNMDDKDWFYSETTLCGAFHTYYDKYDKDPSLYEKSKSYLSKVDELGRKPFPFYMWIVIGVLVILEALGFGYVLAGWTIPGASESLQQQGAFGIALIISIILVAFTHFTGYEIYKNSLINKVRVWFINDRNDNKPDLERDTDVTLEHNDRDDNKPNYSKLLNRIQTNATVTQSWLVSIITAILVISIAIGATYVRGQVLEKQLTEEVTNSGTNMFSGFPGELAAPQQQADTKAMNDKIDSDRKGGWATFIVLAVIFVFIQLLGIMFGYKFGFAGKESKEAFINSYQFRTKQEFIEYYKKQKQAVAKIAQQKLQELQQKMAQRAVATGTSAKQAELIKNRENRTFLNYVHLKNDESLQHDYNDSVSRKRHTDALNKIDSQTVVVKNEESEQIKCTKCNTTLEKDTKFCSNCGTPTEQKPKIPTCPKCGKTYESGIKFCQEDGSPLELA